MKNLSWGSKKERENGACVVYNEQWWLGSVKGWRWWRWWVWWEMMDGC